MITRFALGQMGVQKPFYIDVGAFHPYNLSNTAHFHGLGCRGINVEPNPVLFRAFPVERDRDVNLNVGVLDRPGEMDFYVMSPDTMSTFSREHAQKLIAEYGFVIRETPKIKVRTLTQILEEHAGGAYPHFLSLDVEGFEQAILGSIDFNVWSPLAICCETISFSQTGQGEKNVAVIEFLKSRGYMVYADTYINTIFVLEKAWKRQK